MVLGTTNIGSAGIPAISVGVGTIVVNTVSIRLRRLVPCASSRTVVTIHLSGVAIFLNVVGVAVIGVVTSLVSSCSVTGSIS